MTKSEHATTGWARQADALDASRRAPLEEVGSRPPAPPRAPPRRWQRPARGPGRPRLGVVAREITLLPRHWDWLNAQPGGASVALRRLVEGARKLTADGARCRVAQEAGYRFMHALGGNLPGYEDATRALFASNFTRFEEALARWPDDVREHASLLAADAFEH